MKAGFISYKDCFVHNKTGCDPFNQNFQAEVQKFLSVKQIATGANSLVPFHSQNKFRAHLKWRM